MSNEETRPQQRLTLGVWVDRLKGLVRYGLVGVLVNLAGYLLYLGLTWLGVEPKTAMSIVFFSGSALGYIGHRRYSFRYEGKVGGSMLRYAMAHGVGYVLNFLLLYVFSDIAGYPHQLVQAVAIFIVAFTLYLLFKFVVFPRETAEDSR